MFLASSVAILAGPAAAQTGFAGGPFRLGLDANAVAHDKVTLASGEGAASNPAVTTKLGLPGTALGVVLGYSVTPNVLLGGRLMASSAQSSLGDVTTESTSLAIAPYAEYVFDGAVVRPYIAAHVGYGSTNSSTGDMESSVSSFLIGPGAGVHAFATPTFSIDGGLVALFQQAHAKAGPAELSGSGYTVLVTVGLSGWLGGSAEMVTAPSATPVPEQAREQPPSTVVTENTKGVLETSVTLDLPDASGGIEMTVKGEPKRDASAVRIVITWLRSQESSAQCTSAAFESGGRRTELGDVQSFARQGFGSSQLTQQGTLPLDVLDSLADPASEARLTLCSEQVIIQPAAKRRFARLLRAFKQRLSAEAPAPPQE
jgi:hypothetical protein